MSKQPPFFIFILPFYIGLIALTLPAHAAFTWKSIPNFPPGGRYGPTEFVIGSIAYVSCGVVTGIISQNDLWAYDQITNSWTQKANIPTLGKSSPRSFVINGKGYVMTGWTPAQTSDLWEYDPVLNNWTQKTNFPGGARYTGIAISIGAKGYFGTGYAPLYNDWWEFDPGLNSWTQKANVPGSVRQSAIAFEINGLGYAGLGSNQPTFGSDFDDFYSYDPATNLWTTLPNFPGGVRYGCEEFVLCGKGYVGLGKNSSGSTYSDFYKYDPVTNAWAFAGNYAGGYRNAGTGFSIGEKGYAGLGSNGTFLNDLWEYSAEPDSFTYTLMPCGNTVSFTAFPSTADFYLWNFGDTSTSIFPNPVHTYNSNGTYTVSLITTTACVIDTFSMQLMISGNLPVQASFSYSLDTCMRTVSFFNGSLNGTTYVWNFGDSTTSANQNPVHTYSINGNYVVTLLVFNACDTDSVQQSVLIPVGTNPNSLFNFTVDSCTASVTFNNLSTGASGYVWNFGDGDTSSLLNPVHVYNQAGNYNILLVSSALCGSDTASVSISILPALAANSLFVYSIDSCTLEINFTNQSVNGFSYAWDFGDGNTSNAVNPIHLYNDTGVYQVLLVATSNSCGADTLIQILHLLRPKEPVSAFSILATDSCTRSLTLFNSSTDAKNYFWSFGNGQTSSLASPVIQYQDSGNYTIQLIAYGSCTNDTIQKSVFIPESPSILADFTMTLDTCSNSLFLISKSENSVSWQWYFQDGDSSQLENPIHIYNTPGTYMILLIAENATGCKDSVVYTFELAGNSFSHIFIPNCFTPNGDGLNETFKILNADEYCGELEILIYNRWGELVFQSATIQNEWDGRFRKKRVPDGVYFYILRGTQYRRTGSVSVLN